MKGFNTDMKQVLGETGELTIEIPALPRPTLKELNSGWGLVSRIWYDYSPTGPVTLKLATVLLPHESRIIGTEYMWRIVLCRNVVLGHQHAMWLEENMEKFPQLLALPTPRGFKEFCIDFPGMAMIYNKRPSFPVFNKWRGNWDIGLEEFYNDFARDRRIAIASI